MLIAFQPFDFHGWALYPPFSTQPCLMEMTLYLDRFEPLYEIDRLRIPEPEGVRMRLQRNEKPEAWPDDLQHAIYSSMPKDLLQQYPDPTLFYQKISALLNPLAVAVNLQSRRQNRLYPRLCDVQSVFADVRDRAFGHRLRPDPLRRPRGDHRAHPKRRENSVYPKSKSARRKLLQPGSVARNRNLLSRQ